MFKKGDIVRWKICGKHGSYSGCWNKDTTKQSSYLEHKNHNLKIITIEEIPQHMSVRCYVTCLVCSKKNQISGWMGECSYYHYYNFINFYA